MGRVFVVELEGRVYKCKFCKTHLTLAEDLVSRSFSCRRGKAYLFNSARLKLFEESYNQQQTERMLLYLTVAHEPLFILGVNITMGPLEERQMLSGMHTVADIFCCCCGQIVGWKYEAAHDKSQKYKEGKIVLERGRIIDGFESEFNLDARYGVGASDPEDA